MKMRNVLLVFVLCFVFPMLVFSQARRLRPRLEEYRRRAGVDIVEKVGLPDQPRCNTQTLPDIIIEKFQFSGPGGPWRPNQQYGVAVVLKNRGQCQSGVFMVQLQVRVQSQAKVETLTVGTRKVNSIFPAKTGTAGTAAASFNYTTAGHPWAQYTFTATADYTNHIEEFDEGNNSKTSIDQVVDINR
jgi:hypothetical protein